MGLQIGEEERSTGLEPARPPLIPRPAPYATQAIVRRGGDGVERRAAALGWFSLGLGALQLLAPRAVARLIGMDPDGTTALAMRALGVRELTSGIGLLTQQRPASWAWARVGGDVMDLALLATVLTDRDTDRSKALAATAAVLGVTALDAKTAIDLHRRHPERGDWEGFEAKAQITVNRSIEDVYGFFRDFTNLPRFMVHLESVRTTSTNDRRSHWVAKGPLGSQVEWDAEIVEDRPRELIAWRSVDLADVPNRGSVRFMTPPGGMGTEVHVEIQYYPPGGRLGAGVAKLFGKDPAREVREDLRRFKQVMEIGEVTRSDSSWHTGMHPARPSSPRVTPQPTRVIA